jgi:hypothetical protein
VNRKIRSSENVTSIILWFLILYCETIKNYKLKIRQLIRHMQEWSFQFEMRLCKNSENWDKNSPLQTSFFTVIIIYKTIHFFTMHQIVLWYLLNWTWLQMSDDHTIRNTSAQESNSMNWFYTIITNVWKIINKCMKTCYRGIPCYTRLMGSYKSLHKVNSF